MEPLIFASKVVSKSERDALLEMSLTANCDLSLGSQMTTFYFSVLRLHMVKNSYFSLGQDFLTLAVRTFWVG